MPGRDGPENLKILKKSLLKVDIGPWRQRIEFLPLRHRVEFLRLKDEAEFLWISTNRDLKHDKMHRTCVGWDSMVSIVWLRNTFKNSVSPRVEETKSEVNKCICIWTTESACFHLHLYCVFAYVFNGIWIYVLYYCCDWDHCDYITICLYTHKEMLIRPCSTWTMAVMRTHEQKSW